LFFEKGGKMNRMMRENLKKALKKSWSRETSSDPNNWTPENPAWGQCAVTALIVQDYFGGNLIRATVNERGVSSHYWNELPDGIETDLTQDQFSENFNAFIKGHCLQETKTREYVLSHPATVKRYEILKQRVEKYLKEKR
jgi:hypothetical protein